MKLNIKHLYITSLLCVGGMGVTSCDDFLDREPITSVTPEAYFSNADQVASYLNRYYDSYLVNSQGQALYHQRAWNAGVPNNDNNTDNFIKGEGSQSYFDGQWTSSAGQNLKSDYGIIRVWNYLINTVEAKLEAGEIQGDASLINHYLGEAYFFRAMAYYNTMVRFGDLPIITEVLPNDEAYLQELSVRAPRNQVARFILQDLDKAASLMKDAGFQNNQRINKQVALLYKSRVALFEGTFEKYHQGSGRVPGDANWPGGSFSGNIQSEISFFLGEAMSAAAQVADAIQLTENTGVMDPAYGQIYGWNPYFEMFGQPSLASVPEVLLWKEYSGAQNITHNAPYRLQVGDKSGFTRSLVSTFLMKNGLPIYAEGSGYQGDVTIDDQKVGRDERMQLFVWGESNVHMSDPAFSNVSAAGDVILWNQPLITNSNLEIRDITGYRQRKYYNYDNAQQQNDALMGTAACPIFRAAEAYLNYIEACYELNGNIDAKATNYWKAIRERAGVDTDFQKTIDATDLAKEVEFQDLGVWSGDNMVDKTLFNIRRERRSEFMGEGMRWDDLKRWRSFDRLFTEPFIVEGFNLWDAAYANYDGTDSAIPALVADDTSESNASPKEFSKYLCPLNIFSTNNTLYDGYTWKKAYYLQPIGIEELSLAPQLYQNPYWPTESAGLALE